MNMNRLQRTDRARILHLLVEGASIRSISRLTGASINTVSKLLVDAGNACAAHHDAAVRNVAAKRVQVDEIWSFVYAKQKNVERARKAPSGAGDCWTWTAIEADSKLVISWLVGPRDSGSAYTLMDDLHGRLASRVQLTTDGLNVYPNAVEDAFGADVDFSQLIKLYGREPAGEQRYSPPACLGAVPRPVQGDPDPKHISTSYVERQNLNIRMGIRRFTRLTNAFSKKLENQIHSFALYLTYANWCRIHKTIRTSPAQAAGLTETLRDMEWIVGLIEERTPPAGPRGPYKKKDPN